VKIRSGTGTLPLRMASTVGNEGDR
jgi:hypothetical protein